MWRSEQSLITCSAVPQCQVTRLMISQGLLLHPQQVCVSGLAHLPPNLHTAADQQHQQILQHCPSPGTRGLEKHLSFIWNPPWLSRKAETLHKHMQSIKETGNKKTETFQRWGF